MGVTSQIFHNAGCGFKRRFAVYHPFLVVAVVQKRVVNVRLLQFEQCQKLTPELTGQSFYRQEELLFGIYPLTELVQSSGRNNAVNMGMERKILSPCMQYSSQANCCAKIFGVGGKFRFFSSTAPNTNRKALL